MSHPTTRRDFLKTSAVAGGALAANLSLLANAHADGGKDEIRVGLVGCGGRGSGAVDNCLHSAPNVKVVAIGDVFKSKTDSLRRRLTETAENDEALKKLGNKVDLPEDRCFAGLDAYEKVINHPDVNYIILATPPGFRPLHLQAAVASGKNIFTEKPVGVDGPGIRKVLAAYEESLKKNLHIAAGTQRRHQAPYIETVKQIHDGAIGDITALRCYWNNQGIWFHNRSDLAGLGIPDSDLAYQLYNWYHFLWVCGDHIVEQHVHNLDVCNWVMKTHPIRATGVGGRHESNNCPAGPPEVAGNIWNEFCVDFEYPHGVHMLSMCQHISTCQNNVSEAVSGTKGTCQVNRYAINGKTVTRDRGVDPYVQEHTDLIESIRSGKPLNELKQVAESTMTAILGRMSSYTGRTLTWDQALNSKDDTFPEHLSWEMSIQVPGVPVAGKTKFV